jgi:glutaminyl-peptide cyclotransferase
MKFNSISFVLFLAGIALVQGCADDKPDQPAWTPEQPAIARTTPPLTYTVVNKYPHDQKAFTEGLIFHNGQLLESTGSPDNMPETRSLFGVVDLKSGKIDVKAELDRKTYFGEGIAVVGDKLYQVTWQNQKGFIYDAKTFTKTGQFSYQNKEGWGLTSDGKHLIMSDGSYSLTWFDPASMQPVKTVNVTKDGFALDHLNELEWINGFIYANVWMTNKIVKIDPATGVVVAEADCSDLFYEAGKDNPKLSEMNGIAYNAATGQLLVTGKMWPWYYELRFGG